VRLDDDRTDHAQHGLLIAVAAAVALAGCGGNGATTRTNAAAAPCPAKPAAALARAAGAPAGTPRLLHRAGVIVTCTYTAGASRVRLVVDDAPQAWHRWQAALVERTQATMEWGHTPSLAPHDVHGVGAGAFWVNGPRLLIATDGRRLVTTTVLAPIARAAARRLASRIAAAALGPIRVPVATGP
jgi:hypothetical protein